MRWTDLCVNTNIVKTAKEVQELAADNIKRVVSRAKINWMQTSSQHPYLIRDTQEVKTTWHPIGT